MVGTKKKKNRAEDKEAAHMCNIWCRQTMFRGTGLYKSWNNRDLNAASPEYIAFHSMQCCWRVTQIFLFYFFCFCFVFRQLGGEKIRTKICPGNEGKRKTQMRNDSWCRMRKVLTWGHAENMRRSSEACKKTKVAFRCRWFIAFYLVTSGVAFRLHRPLAPASMWTRKRPRKAPEFVPFQGLRGEKEAVLQFPSFIWRYEENLSRARTNIFQFDKCNVIAVWRQPLLRSRRILIIFSCCGIMSSSAICSNFIVIFFLVSHPPSSRFGLTYKLKSP